MKSKVYTRTGDKGTTSLVDGSRASKDCLRISAYGTIDELSSTLGLLAAMPDCPDEIKEELTAVQRLMFEIGGYLATPVKPGEEPVIAGLTEETARLEGWIDAIDERLPKLSSFVLPGGTQASAQCHVARTVCRRAEREIISLEREEFVDAAVVGYINRLSDYLFVVSRYLNFLAGVEDVAWKPRTAGV